jgi:hypothetical protein
MASAWCNEINSSPEGQTEDSTQKAVVTSRYNADFFFLNDPPSCCKNVSVGFIHCEFYVVPSELSHGYLTENVLLLMYFTL